MILQMLSDQTRVVRRVNVDGVDTPVVTGVVEPWFWSRLTEPSTPTRDEGGRLAPTGTLRYAEGFMGIPAGNLVGGDRVEDKSAAIWEVVGASRAIHNDNSPRNPIIGWDAPVQRLETLWPVSGQLIGQDGTVIANVLMDTWSPSESQNPRGRYETMSAALPIEHASQAVPNASVLVQGDRYKIVDSVVDKRQARVELTIRRSGG